MNISEVIQRKNVAAQLFSSALFCLWLSTASLVVWMDFGRGISDRAAHTPAEQAPHPVPVQQNTATPVRADAA
jgi:hypothetical protein